jgi:hypothetical protein
MTAHPESNRIINIGTLQTTPHDPFFTCRTDYEITTKATISEFAEAVGDHSHTCAKKA